MTIPGGSWAGGWDEPGVLSVVLINAGTPGSGLFVYSGTPAGGNLVYSVTGATGTDPFGNKYLAGETSYNNGASPSPIAYNLNLGSITWYTYTPNPGAVFTAVTQVSLAKSGSVYGLGANGFINLKAATANNGIALIQPTDLGTLEYTTSNTNATADGNTYTVGRAISNVTNTVLINSAVTPVPIVSGTVAAARYRVGIRIVYLGGGTGANAGLSWFGTSTVGNTLGVVRRARGSTNTDNVLPVNQNSALGSLAFPFNAGELCTYEFDGQITFSAAGTFGVQGIEGTAGDTWSVAANSYLELIPTT